MKKKTLKATEAAMLPMDGQTLQDIRYSQSTILNMYKDIHYHATQIARLAMRLDEDEARVIDAGLELRDIRMCATYMSQHLGIAKNLLENIGEDVMKISRKRMEYVTSQKKLQQQREALQQQLREANAKKAKRQAEKAADATE